MVVVTDAAAEKIKALIDKDGHVDGGLRMGVMGGGCSGFQYKLEFAEDSGDMDHVFEIKGVKIFIDMKSSLAAERGHVRLQRWLDGSGF